MPGASPIAQDIFVEVDGMKRKSGGFLGWGGCDGHKMSSNAKEKVIKAFKNHFIQMHIDTGNMGGGGLIPHDSNFNYPDDWRNTYDNYFTSNRHGIYHYCVIAHTTSGNFLGEGLVADDQFVLYDANLGDDWWPGGVDRATKQASTFIHELGHNINIYDDDDTDNDWVLDRWNWIFGEDDEDGEGNDIQNDGDNRNEDDDDDHTFEDYCENSNCAMTDSGFPLWYCDHHWGQADLASSF